MSLSTHETTWCHNPEDHTQSLTFTATKTLKLCKKKEKGKAIPVQAVEALRVVRS
jgi:hypothetical protein